MLDFRQEATRGCLGQAAMENGPANHWRGRCAFKTREGEEAVAADLAAQIRSASTARHWDPAYNREDTRPLAPA